MSIQRLSNAGQSGYRYKTLIAGITPVPSVPVIGTATAVTFSTASVTFTAPGAYAGSTYTATSSPGGYTGTSASSPIIVSGLSGETSYTFTVTATNATGTSGASAASNSITTPAEWSPEGAYDSLATVTLSASTASITFSGIPSGYKHLQLRCSVRMNRADAADNMAVQFNGDTSTNYSFHDIRGDGSNAGAETGVSISAMYIPDLVANNPSSNIFSAAVIDILDYGNTNKNKTIRSLSGNDINGGGAVSLSSGNWRSTSTVTSITIGGRYGSGFILGSTIALYGVK